MRRTKRKKQHRRKTITVFFLMLLLLGGLLLLRTCRTESAPLPAQPTASEEPAAETSSPAETPQPTETPPAIPEETSAVLTAAPAPTSERKGYSAETYNLVSEMIYIRRHDVPDADAQIRELERRLDETDPALGELWTEIMEYWRYANTEMPVNRALPDDLPQDDSLCLVVLGYQLLYDGDMAPELLGRCELALQCARQYPNAYLAVTGGGTAFKDKDVTEAGVMADWFLAQGISPERIIREDASLTTDQNAVNTCAILAEQYPQIKHLAIISSDYHLSLGCTMFTEAALLYGYERGAVP